MSTLPLVRKLNTYARGVLAMIASAALFSVMSALIRLATNINSFQMAFFRFIIGMTILLSLALAGKIKLRFNNRKVLAVRGVTGGLAVFLFYLSIEKIGLAKGTVISNTYPLFATFLGIFWLKEQVKPLAWIPVITCLSGISLLSYDGSLNSFSIDVWEALALSGSLFSGIAVVSVRKLASTDSPHSIYLSQCVIGAWMAILPANVESPQIGLLGVFLLLSVGLIATVAQIMMTWAYGRIDVSTGSLLSMLMAVFNVVIGVTFFREAQNIVGILGMIIVILSCAWIVFINSRPVSLSD